MTTAIILFNLGGPASLDAVQPFLFNLFYDRAILRLPNPFRFLIAKLISSRRTPTAKEIYGKIGGKSPILENTIAQQQALENGLREKGVDAKVFISMRYAPPFMAQTMEQIKEIKDLDQIILLPLYPQFSTTTTASSFKEWDEHFKKLNSNVRVKKICCYPKAAGFISAQTKLILEKVRDFKGFRILFSAHGLPESIVKSGDPYPLQVESTAALILQKLEEHTSSKIDSVVCFQSRVGPVKWIGPSTEDEIKRASQDQKNIILVPLSFVSEHSETLVELDLEYAELAHELNIKKYIRIGTVSNHPKFINFLVDITLKIMDDADNVFPGIYPEGGRKICPTSCKGCPCK